MVKKMFDEKNIVLRAAVISDVHLLYAYHSGEDISRNLEKYASAIGDLYCLADGKLDAIMMCGDYCDLGCEAQARTFAQSTKAICDGIFKGKKSPKLLIGMGNHDTCWRNEKYSCMSAEEWYRIFDEYGLTEGFSEKSDTTLGNIHIEIPKGDDTYYFLYVETEDYAENVFKPETLSWLDKMLSEITNKNPERFVFVGTHAPISESGTYGTDVKLEGGAVWATAKNNIDNVLSKYPQVILFSGHTHFSLELETAIMQKNYTAINVPPVLSRDYYNSQYSKFLDSQYPDTQHGMGVYIEADMWGNIKIKRVNFSKVTAKTEGVNCKKAENPAFGKYANQSPEIFTAELKSCSLVSEEEPSVCGDDWVIDAPDKEKRHLEKYSMLRGKVKPPVFPEKAEFILKNTETNKLSIQFPAAISERNILYYVITIYDNSGEKYAEFKVLGNWCETRKGVVIGKNHKDAELFEYEMPLVTLGEYIIELVAVDEYGNQSKSIRIKNRENKDDK